MFVFFTVLFSIISLSSNICCDFKERDSFIETPSSSQFGTCVSMDGNYFVVGSPYNNDKVNGAGCVHVFFQTTPGNWVLQEKLYAGVPGLNDGFGYSVYITGDYIIAGAPSRNSPGMIDSGAAYIFHRNGATWEQKAYLEASDKNANANFGRSCAIDVDYAICGAFPDDAAYIFKRKGDVWNETKILKGTSGDFFGISVSISGDNAIVGAYLDDGDSLSNSGAAYVYHRDGEDWLLVEKLRASDPGVDYWFGERVDISGDYVVVGSKTHDQVGKQVFTKDGAVYIFRNTHIGASPWEEEAILFASDAADNNEFGVSVGISGDYVIVGATKNGVGGNDAGSAYIFHRTNVTWVERERLLAGNAEAGDEFGNEVSITSLGDAVVGAFKKSSTNEGAVYVFSKCENDCDWEMGRGECINKTRCKCVSGWGGEIGNCSLFSCSNCTGQNRECSGPNNCTCMDGWESPDCNVPVCSPKCVHGKCKIKKSEHYCQCDKNYKGKSCSKKKELLDDLLDNWIFFSGGAAVFVLILFCLLLFCCILCCMIIICIIKFQKRDTRQSKDEISLLDDEANKLDNVDSLKIDRSLFEIDFRSIKLKKKLGDGGSDAQIFLSDWKGREVAVKMFNSRSLTDDLDLKQFYQELKIISSVNHPNLIQVFSFDLFTLVFWCYTWYVDKFQLILKKFLELELFWSIVEKEIWLNLSVEASCQKRELRLIGKGGYCEEYVWGWNICTIVKCKRLSREF